MWILRKCSEYLSYRTPLNNCLCYNFPQNYFFKTPLQNYIFVNARFHGKFISNVGINYFVGIQLRKKNLTVIANGRRILAFHIFISFIYFMIIEINHAWISQFLTILDYIWISERNSQLSLVLFCWVHWQGKVQ